MRHGKLLRSVKAELARSSRTGSTAQIAARSFQTENKTDSTPSHASLAGSDVPPQVVGKGGPERHDKEGQRIDSLTEPILDHPPQYSGEDNLGVLSAPRDQEGLLPVPRRSAGMLKGSREVEVSLRLRGEGKHTSQGHVGGHAGPMVTSSSLSSGQYQRLISTASPASPSTIPSSWASIPLPLQDVQSLRPPLVGVPDVHLTSPVLQRQSTTNTSVPGVPQVPLKPVPAEATHPPNNLHVESPPPRAPVPGVPPVEVSLASPLVAPPSLVQHTNHQQGKLSEVPSHVDLVEMPRERLKQICRMLMERKKEMHRVQVGQWTRQPQGGRPEGKRHRQGAGHGSHVLQQQGGSTRRRRSQDVSPSQSFMALLAKVKDDMERLLPFASPSGAQADLKEQLPHLAMQKVLPLREVIELGSQQRQGTQEQETVRGLLAAQSSPAAKERQQANLTKNLLLLALQQKWKQKERDPNIERSPGTTRVPKEGAKPHNSPTKPAAKVAKTVAAQSVEPPSWATWVPPEDPHHMEALIRSTTAGPTQPGQSSSWEAGVEGHTFPQQPSASQPSRLSNLYDLLASEQLTEVLLQKLTAGPVASHSFSDAWKSLMDQPSPVGPSHTISEGNATQEEFVGTGHPLQGEDPTRLEGHTASSVGAVDGDPDVLQAPPSFTTLVESLPGTTKLDMVANPQYLLAKAEAGETQMEMGDEAGHEVLQAPPSFSALMDSLPAIPELEELTGPPKTEPGETHAGTGDKAVSLSLPLASSPQEQTLKSIMMLQDPSTKGSISLEAFLMPRGNKPRDRGHRLPSTEPQNPSTPQPLVSLLDALPGPAPSVIPTMKEGKRNKAKLQQVSEYLFGPAELPTADLTRSTTQKLQEEEVAERGESAAPKLPPDTPNLDNLLQSHVLGPLEELVSSATQPRSQEAVDLQHAIEDLFSEAGQLTASGSPFTSVLDDRGRKVVSSLIAEVDKNNAAALFRDMLMAGAPPVELSEMKQPPLETLAGGEGNQQFTSLANTADQQSTPPLLDLLGTSDEVGSIRWMEHLLQQSQQSELLGSPEGSSPTSLVDIFKSDRASPFQELVAREEPSGVGPSQHPPGYQEVMEELFRGLDTHSSSHLSSQPDTMLPALLLDGDTGGLSSLSQSAITDNAVTAFKEMLQTGGVEVAEATREHWGGAAPETLPQDEGLGNVVLNLQEAHVPSGIMAEVLSQPTGQPMMSPSLSDLLSSERFTGGAARIEQFLTHSEELTAGGSASAAPGEVGHVRSVDDIVDGIRSWSLLSDLMTREPQQVVPNTGVSVVDAQVDASMSWSQLDALPRAEITQQARSDGQESLLEGETKVVEELDLDGGLHLAEVDLEEVVDLEDKGFKKRGRKRVEEEVEWENRKGKRGKDKKREKDSVHMVLEKHDRGKAGPSAPVTSRWAQKLKAQQQQAPAAMSDDSDGSSDASDEDEDLPAKSASPPPELVVDRHMTVSSLASRLKVDVENVERLLVELGDTVSSHEEYVSFESAELVALEYGRAAVRVYASDGPLVPRPPVVTIMGHVDHGKTTLLDALRNTSVAAQEAGGITQHIGAFQVELPGSGHSLTFLDTPGHAAFSAMRARGAAVTDIVVLVVAVDDGVQPQTREAITHANEAKCPIVVALTKCDVAQSRADEVKLQLLAEGLELEEYGGTVQVVEVAAKQGKGLVELEEAVLLQAELMSLQSSKSCPAEAHVVEARLDPGLGPVATVVVHQGTLRVGDPVVVGTEYGRVRSLRKSNSSVVEEVLPGEHALVAGLRGLPLAGDRLQVVASEERARTLSRARALRGEEFRRSQTAAALYAIRQKDLETLKEMQKKRRELRGELKMLQQYKGAAKEKFLKLREEMRQQQNEEKAVINSVSCDRQVLNLILKADVQGSLEAIREAVTAMTNDKVEVKVISEGVGPIAPSDLLVADASQGHLITFNLPRPRKEVQDEVDKLKLKVAHHDVIYHLMEEVQSWMDPASGSPQEEEEVIVGQAHVVQSFSFKKKGQQGKVAGCRVVQGLLRREGGFYRVMRGEKVVYEGPCTSMRRATEDVQEVGRNEECGLILGEGAYQDVQPGDVIVFMEKCTKAGAT